MKNKPTKAREAQRCPGCGCHFLAPNDNGEINALGQSLRELAEAEIEKLEFAEWKASRGVYAVNA